MKLFLIKILTYALIALVVLFAADYAVTKGLRKTGYKEFTKMREIFDESKPHDVLIMGGSDAAQHMSSYLVDSIFGANSFNLGATGHTFLMQHAYYTNYLKNRNGNYPKMVIQVMGPQLWSMRKDLYNYKLYLPYINQPAFSAYTKKFDGLTWADYHVPFVKYSGDIESLKIGIWEFFNLSHYPSDLYKGYLSHNRPWDDRELDQLKAHYPTRMEVDKDIVMLFENYIKDLQSKNVKVVLIQSPLYMEAQQLIVNVDSVFNLYQQFADKNGVPFYNYSKDSLAYKRDNFNDCFHLNKPFAEDFASRVLTKIKQDMDRPKQQ
jgi:hypothetical protein